MIGLVIVGVLILVLALPALGWVRSRGRDEKSIETHRSTLGVIEHAAGVDEQPERWRHRSTAHVRIVGAPAAVPRPAVGGAEWRPSGRHSRRPSFPSRRESTRQPPQLPVGPAAMDRDVARLLAAQARRAATAVPASADATPAAEPQPASAPRRPPRRPSSRWISPPSTGPHLAVVLASLAAAIIMAAVIGVALNSPQGAPSRPAAVAPAHHTATGGPAAPPPSTAPPPPSLVATSANSTNAAYTVNAAALDVELVAAGPCWVELRDGTPSGPVVFEGTLRSGVSQIFHAVGAIWLRLGHPAGVKMSIDGSAVALPASANPFDVSVSSPTGA